MIFYGTKRKQIGKEFITEKCPNCGAQTSIDMHVFQKYAHVYWLPFFPINKTGVSQCASCKQILEVKQMPPSIKAFYDELKAKSKTPIWTFSGLALLAVIIVIAVISGKQNDEKNAKLIAAPIKGDIYEVKTDAGQYTLYLVDEVLGDSIFLRTNNYETNKSSGISDLKRKGMTAYSEDTYAFSKGEIKAKFDKKEIFDVDR
ncbi:MAG: hypothetical protein ABIX01_02120 [Chitinophagaceae bacterium]